MKNIRLLSILIFATSTLVSCVSEHKSSEPIVLNENFKSCAIVDTDFGVDDLRAISLILPRYNYTLLVATEGQTRAPFGVKIGERFLQTVIGSYSGDVFEGKASSRPQKTVALGEKRESLESMNGLLPAKIAAVNPHKVTDADFKQQLTGCEQVTVFLLAPYTSFHAYREILPNGTKVLANGTFPSPKNKQLGFNCEYDSSACFALTPYIQKYDMKFIKFSPKYSYYLTSSEILSLKDSDLEKLVRDIHNANSTTWDVPTAQMADDAVALYLYAPDKFQNKGRQYYPKMKPEQFRETWTQAFDQISKEAPKRSLVN